MKEEAFAQLVESIQQAGEIKRGLRQPSRVFEISPLDVKAISRSLSSRVRDQQTVRQLTDIIKETF